jgi:PIN domain nuclease of toxin-antitoxin system
VSGLLLDTHVWLWSLLEPDRITPDVAATLESEDAELWLSPISLWETLVLAEKGRLDLGPSSREWVENALEAVPLHEAPVTSEVALATAGIELHHRDPADRFLLATAKVFDLTLVTADRRLLDQTAVPVLANR